MRTLKILFVLCIMLGFTTNAVNAQAEVTKEYFIGTGQFMCMDEAASGEVMWLTVQDGNKRFVSYRGKLIGEETGNVYSFKYEIDAKDIFNENNSQAVDYFAFLIVVHCNGKPLGQCLTKIHVTFNANGELTVDNQYFINWECF